MSNSALKILTRSDLPFAWKWNTAYRLRLGLTADTITGEIFSGESVDMMLTEAGSPASTAGFQAALEGREAAWNGLLKDAPLPSGFAFHFVSTHEATADAIRRTYFNAWVFLLADIIPPLPETGFDYPQVACGKPSLWDEGDQLEPAQEDAKPSIDEPLLVLTDERGKFVV